MKILTSHEVIKKIVECDNDYTLHLVSGLSCGLKKKYNVVPQVNDGLTLHTKGSSFGRIVGMDLNGKEIFKVTEEEIAEQSRIATERYDAENKEKYEENKDQMEADYEKLPQAYKDRILKLRIIKPNFQIEFEEYELFICLQSVMITEEFKSAEEISLFSELSWSDQVKRLPKLSEDHSGNTLEGAIYLAKLFFIDKDKIKEARNPLY